MSDVAVTWAKAQTEGVKGQVLTRSAAQVLVHLASYADAEGVAWALVDILRIEMKVKAERTVQRGLAELKALGLIAPTGEMKRHNGRLIPFYQLALDHGPANTRQLLRERGRSATGDMGVTPSGGCGVTRVSPHGRHGCHPTGDMGVTQIGKVNSQEESLGASASECEPDSGPADIGGFEEAFDLYPASGRGVTSEPAARAAWPAAVAAAGGPDRLIAAVRAYAADPVLKRRDFGAPSFQKWLGEGRWRAWLSDAEPRSGLTSKAVWVGPAEVRDAVAACGLSVSAYLDPAGWDGEARTVLAATGVAAERLRREAGRALRALNVGVAIRTSNPQHERASA